MASTSNSPMQFLKIVFWKLAQRGPTNKFNKGALKHRRWGKHGFNNQVSKALFEGYLWKLAQRVTTRALTKGALKHIRWGKDGFSDQVSKACFEGCLWKFAQRGATETLNKGALKHRRWRKDGFNNKVSKPSGNWHKEDQQRHSTREPLNTEAGARIASITHSPMHFLKDIFGNLHKDKQRHSTREPLNTEGGARMASAPKDRRSIRTHGEAQRGKLRAGKIEQGWLQQPSYFEIIGKIIRNGCEKPTCKPIEKTHAFEHKHSPSDAQNG